jgi:hypothetical protein
MKRTGLASLLVVAAACTGEGSAPMPRPTGHVAICVEVDDTANRSYVGGQLAWKGAMKYDAATRTVTKDALWAGPWALLHDDGPWNEPGPGGAWGHECPGAKAGDHVLGATVFMAPPKTQAEFDQGLGYVEYGMIDVAYDRPPPAGLGNGWIWPGDFNGSFALAINQVSDVEAGGMTIPKWGYVDFRITLDTKALQPSSPAWVFPPVIVKSSAWGWAEMPAADDGLEGDLRQGDGVYTLVMSVRIGPGTPWIHTGLLASGDEPEFVWVLGGFEYKGSSGMAIPDGVAAETRCPDGAWKSQPVIEGPNDKTNNNTYIVVPDC